MLKKNQTGHRSDKDRALDIVTRPDIQEGPEKPLRVDIPTSYHKRLAKMKGNAAETLTIKLLVIEALEDLFEKYERGEGHYPMED